MQRERVTDDIYVFTSDRYAQVTAGAVITDEGAILIDTLAYPDETRQIKQFIENRLGAHIRYVVNTHYHADHTTGTYLFPDVQVIAHQRCRDLLDVRGRDSIERSRTNSPEMQDVELVLPDILFNERFSLRMGRKTFNFWWTPGHSMDSIVCFVEEDQVLFAADTIMPIPYFVDGDYSAFVQSLGSLKHYPLENIIQGHGEVVLRGEIDNKVRSDLVYLQKIRDAVDQTLMNNGDLAGIDIEDCGKSRILMNGMVQDLHYQNVLHLAKQRRKMLQLDGQ